MNNAAVKELLDACAAELDNIAALLEGLGDAAKPTPYMKKYAVIRATGSIEVGFKQIIADRIDAESGEQVRNYIRKMVRESSANPRLDRIISIIGDFDDRWKERFKEQVALDGRPQLDEALTALVKARNDFAHGGSPDVEIADTISNFGHAVRVIEILDDVVHHDYSGE